jgi:hypothetical protein
MLGTADERVETATMAEETAPAYSIECSCDSQRMKGAFQPRRMRDTLAALALRYKARHYCMYQAASILHGESMVVELRRDRALEGSGE